MDELVITQDKPGGAPGAITKVTGYVSSQDGAVVIEIDTDANYETEVRVYVNDGHAWKGTV